MDPASAIGSVLAAVGLSGAAGLNAWLPLFAGALLDRLGVVDLGAPFGDLSTTPALVVLGVLLAADEVGDKIPAVDHVLHAAGTVVHPLAGAALFAGQAGVHLPTWVSIAAGALVAGSLHAGRATIRPASTAATGGAGNPLLSLTEDAASAVLTALAFLVPLLAFAAVAGLLVLMALGVRRVRRLAARRSRSSPPRAG